MQCISKMFRRATCIPFGIRHSGAMNLRSDVHLRMGRGNSRTFSLVSQVMHLVVLGVEDILSPTPRLERRHLRCGGNAPQGNIQE